MKKSGGEAAAREAVLCLIWTLNLHSVVPEWSEFPSLASVPGAGRIGDLRDTWARLHQPVEACQVFTIENGGEEVEFRTACRGGESDR